jgi:phage terminase small subunit
MPTRATRKGATAAKRAPKKTPAKARASKPQVTAPPDPALPLANAQHERFAIEYQKDLNGTQAYLRAYDGVGVASAATIAWRLLRKVEVAARVQYLHRQAMQSLGVEAKEVLQGMVRVAKADIRKVINQDGAALPVHEWPDEFAMAVAGVEIYEEYQGRGEERELVGYTKKFRLNDRVAALGQLGKHFKLFTEKVELAGPNGGAIPVQSQESPEQKAALTAVRKRLAALEQRAPVPK